MIFSRKYHSEQGFALIVVLITLLILALVVGGLLQNQTLFLNETSTVFAAAQKEQESHNRHRACLAKLREDLQGSNSTPAAVAVSWVNGGTNTISTTLNGVEVNCSIEVANLPSEGTQWTPVVRLSSTFDSQTEVSELLYPSCKDTTCVYANSNITLLNTSKQIVQTVSPTFAKDKLVEVAWHR